MATLCAMVSIVSTRIYCSCPSPAYRSISRPLLFSCNTNTDPLLCDRCVASCLPDSPVLKSKVPTLLQSSFPGYRPPCTVQRLPLLRSTMTYLPAPLNTLYVLHTVPRGARMCVIVSARYDVTLLRAPCHESEGASNAIIPEFQPPSSISLTSSSPIRAAVVAT